MHTCQEELFCLLENASLPEQIGTIIYEALKIKKNVVEKDEKESGLRKVLNFGHTLGHGIEVTSDLYHGECVALGMLPMCGLPIRKRVADLLGKLSLPVNYAVDVDKAMEAVSHDKKASGSTVDVVTVEKVGRFTFEKMDLNELKMRLEEVLP